jgi:hypothetical protein
MASYSKKFVTSFFHDLVGTRSLSVVKLFETPLHEVKIILGDETNFNTYTALIINPYTMEEELIMYPVIPHSGGLPLPIGLEVVVVHTSPPPARYHTVINIE